MGSGMTSTVSGCTDMWSVSTREERRGREFDMKSCTKMKNDKREDWWFPLKSWIIDSVWVLKKVPLLLLCTLKSIEVRCTKNRNDYFMVSFFFAFQPSVSVYDMTIPLALKYTLLSHPKTLGKLKSFADAFLLNELYWPNSLDNENCGSSDPDQIPLLPPPNPETKKMKIGVANGLEKSSQWTTHRGASCQSPPSSADVSGERREGGFPAEGGRSGGGA